MNSEGRGVPPNFPIEVTFDMDSTRVIKRAKLLDGDKLVDKISMNVTLQKVRGTKTFPAIPMAFFGLNCP